MKLLDLKKIEVSKEIEISERELSDLLLKNWKQIFHNITLIKREFSLQGQVRDAETGGRIDFFGYNSFSKKFVIVEIKNVYDKNIRSQILDYADFIEDNFDFISLQAKEIIPEIKPLKNSFELILLAKKFKKNDYSRIERLEYSTKLITYRYFENNKITIDTFENKKPKLETKKTKSEIRMPNNTIDFKKVINNFWGFFSNSVSSEIIIANRDYRINGPELFLRIDSIYTQYTKNQLEINEPFASLKQLKELLTSINAYKYRKKAVKFGKQVTSAYIFDLLKLKNDYNI